MPRTRGLGGGRSTADPGQVVERHQPHARKRADLREAGATPALLDGAPRTGMESVDSAMRSRGGRVHDLMVSTLSSAVPQVKHMPHSRTSKRRTLTQKPTSTRFNIDKATANVYEMIKKTGTRQRDVAFAAGMDESGFTQKLQRVRKPGSESIRNKFNLNELGLIGEFFSKLLHKPLTGWPLFTEEKADLIDASLAHFAPRRR